MVLLVSIGIATHWGAGSTTLATLWKTGGHLSAMDEAILLRVRLPRVLLAAVLGGALTTAGVVFQALLRNPLADPYVLGVSGGASLGGVLALLLGLGQMGTPLGGAAVPAFAFVGAFAALLVIERIATIDGRVTAHTILLTGAIVNAFSGAFLFFVQSLASLQQLHAIVFYLMGSVPSYGYSSIAFLGATAFATSLGLFTMARDYNALSLGEEGAAQLGVELHRVKRRTFLLGSLLTALAVSVAGLIGFVGLIVPHILRLVLGPDHRLLIPAAFLGGAAFLVWADLFARLVVAPNEIPVGVMTALLGGPFFLHLMRKSKGRGALG